MKKLFVILCALILMCGSAYAINVTVDLYESADGINPPSLTNPATESPPPIPIDSALQFHIGTGIILESGGPTLDRTFWSDIVFGFSSIGGDIVDRLQLISDGAPNFATVPLVLRPEHEPLFLLEDPSGITTGIVFSGATGDSLTVNVHSDASELGDVDKVPEPSTMLLLGSGLIGLAGYARRKFFKK